MSALDHKEPRAQCFSLYNSFLNFILFIQFLFQFFIFLFFIFYFFIFYFLFFNFLFYYFFCDKQYSLVATNTQYLVSFRY